MATRCDSGQALDTLLGKILRIDVDARPRTPTRPTRSRTTTRSWAPRERSAEIWLTGLRNPWRMHFDEATRRRSGSATSGRASWEEINVAPAGTGGLNYGWSVVEGYDCFRGAECDTTDLTGSRGCIQPRRSGCSVTGGDVYRGSAIPALVGWYVYADYCSGRVWALDAAAALAGGSVETILVMSSGRALSSIAEGPDGELYATDHNGALVRFEAAPD